VVDTSRNGAGPAPDARAQYGATPAGEHSASRPRQLLRVRKPTATSGSSARDSDGSCGRGDPGPGHFVNQSHRPGPAPHTTRDRDGVTRPPYESCRRRRDLREAGQAGAGEVVEDAAGCGRRGHDENSATGIGHDNGVELAGGAR